MTRRTLPLILFVAAAGLSTAPVLAQTHGHDPERHAAHMDASPYAGMQARRIKSLSQSDLEELRRGGGWGLALPAELNGVPGPAHLLELQDEIGLSPDQVSAIETLFETMQTEAIAAGARYIAAEEALETYFADGRSDTAALEDLLASAAEARATLRFSHLSSHLAARDVLTGTQVDRYNRLRGYRD
jgi:Spy/CpxP family protein refolding chaperone